MKPTHEEIGAILGLTQMSLTTPRHVADVFCEYAPHCCMLRVSVYAGGWTHEGKAIFARKSFFNQAGEQSPMDILRETAAVLETLTAQHNAIDMLNAAGVPHCSDCRWWAEDKHTLAPSRQRECRNSEFLHEARCSSDEEASRSLTYQYCEGGQIWTGPDFGCVHFEPITSEAPQIEMEAA